MEKLKFAILGPGIISHRFVKGFRYTKGAELYAVASRDYEKALRYANEYNIPFAYGSYEEMLADGAIDVVYIATPPFLHYQQIKICLQAGKHVLCEKPFLRYSSEAEEVFALAKSKNLVLMEAQKAVFLPSTHKVKEWISDDLLGEVRYMSASYCYDGKFPEEHWVYDKEKAGGAMYDVGVYAVAYLNALADAEVAEQHRLSRYNRHGSDDFTEIIVRYENGIIAAMRGAIRLQTDNVARIYGSKGKIEVPNFWKSNIAYRYDEKELVETFEISQPSEFTYQIQEIIDCIENGLPESGIMSEKATVNVLKIIEDY